MTGGQHNWIRRGVVPLGWAAIVVAPLMCHVAIATGRFTGAAVFLAAMQAAALAAMALRRQTGWQRGLGIAAAAGLLTLLALRSVGLGRAGLIAGSGMSHAVIHGSLLLLFGESLRPGRVALVTGLAQRIRGTLTPAMRAYTRNVTKAWCGFFLAQLLLSAILLGVAPDRVWSLFVNVLDGPSVAAMFLAEFAVRRWRFRHDRHASPFTVIRSFVRDRVGG